AGSGSGFLAHGFPLFLDDLDGHLGAVCPREIGGFELALGYDAVPDLPGVAILVQLEERRRQRLAAVVTLASVGIYADPHDLPACHDVSSLFCLFRTLMVYVWAGLRKRVAASAADFPCSRAALATLTAGCA